MADAAVCKVCGFMRQNPEFQQFTSQRPALLCCRCTTATCYVPERKERGDIRGGLQRQGLLAAAALLEAAAPLHQTIYVVQSL